MSIYLNYICPQQSEQFGYYQSSMQKCNYKRYNNRQSSPQMRHKIFAIILVVSMQIYLSKTQSCNPAHNRELVGGVCVCKAGYYDSGPQNCPSCSSPCMTCVTTATTCTGCNATLYLTLSGTTCICMDGYVSISGVCQPCHYSCRTCSGLASTNCITCDTSIRLFSSNSCLCLNGTYDNSTLQSCQACNAKCLWCSASTSNDCTNCDANLLRQIGTSNPGPCLCYNGFYDTAVALCQPCYYSCVTCAIAATTCLTCDLATQYRSLSGTSCSCIAHYYDSGTAICSMCSPRCGNCTTSADTCLTCNSTLRILNGTSCPCIDGYYEDSATITCLACTNYCKTCVNSSSTCLSCYSYGNRLLYNATCGCITGYYDNGTIFCQRCPYYCNTCAGPDPPVCTSCSPTSHRSLGTGACACDNGYYDDGSSVTCLPCNYSCQTCSSAASMCTSCDSSAHRTQVATECKCDIGYYDDGTNQMCAPCHYSCVSCLGGASNQCYTCQPNRDYTNYSCPCFTGMYQLSQLCYACDTVCATCTTSAAYCLSCPMSRTLVNNTCVCADGYYASGLTCPACSIECATCTTSSTTCLSCNPALGTVLSGSSCICPDKYYKNTTILACLPCHYSCSTCLSSDSILDCRTCDPALYRTLSGPAPSSCLCNVGYFDGGVAVCGICHSHCTSCVGSSDYNCTGCVTGYVLIGSYCKYNTTCLNYLYDNQCLNNCPDSTYGATTASGNMCLPCSNGCLTCTSSTYCLSCNSTTYFNATDHACMQYCPIGHYIQTDGSCAQCPANCLMCLLDTSIICQQCNAGYIKQDGGTCVTACSNGYLLVGTVCHRCPANCRVCTSLSSHGCVTCQTGLHMLSGACHTTCPLGYMPAIVNGQSQCAPCPAQCATCMNNKCLSCTSGYYLNYESNCIPLGYLASWDGTLVTCHPNCKSCTNTSFSSCIMCASLRGDSSQMAESGYCQCKSGSVDTGDGKCDTQAYQTVVKATEVLVGATESTIFLSVIVSIISTNFVLVLGLGNYLQSYSMMYFLNSSAVMQTDIVLEQYYKINPIYYYRTQSNTTASNLSYAKNTRLMLTTQTDQSLFFRGKPWQYLSDWAFLALAVNIVIWAIPIILHIFLCCCFRHKNRITNNNKVTLQQNTEDTRKRCICLIRFCSKFFSSCLKYPFGFYIKQFLDKYNESVAIIFFMLTYAQVSFYAVYSFKNLFIMQLNSQFFSIDILSITLSFIILAYYVLYLLRLLVGCAKTKLEPQSKDSSPLRILFHFYRKNATKKLSKMFLPLLMLRNIGIGVLIVMLAYNPLLQSATCLCLTVLYMLLNFCICPYPGIIRAYFHFSDFFFTLQIGLLTYTTWLPQQSRIGTSKALIALNFIQLALAIGISIWIAITLTNKNICQRVRQKKSNKVAVEVEVEVQKDLQKNIRHQESMSNLIALKQQQPNANKVIFYDMQNVDDNVTNRPQKQQIRPKQNNKNLTEKPREVEEVQLPYRTQKIIKKYRVKHKH